MRKTQPDGGSSGEGRSPLRTRRCFCALEAGVGDRDRRDQRAGVGVARVGVERVAIGLLHHAAEVEHEDAVADVADHREVVADEQAATGRTRAAGASTG